MDKNKKKITKKYKIKRSKKKLQRKTRKMIGGFVPCNGQLLASPDYIDFLNTEVNHDLKEVISHEINLRQQFNSNVLRINSGLLPPPPQGAPPQDAPPINLYNDDHIVRHVIGKTKQQIATPHAREEDGKRVVHSEDICVNTNSGHTVCAFVNIPQQNFSLVDFFPSLFPSQLQSLFPPPQQQEVDKDIFLIVDVGDNFVAKLKETHPPTGTSFSVHQIHSVFTLGDSATCKTKPNSNKKYENKPAHLGCNIYSWEEKIRYTLPPGKSLALSNYQIEMKKSNDSEWNIEQRWSEKSTDTETKVFYTPNSKHSNNVKKVCEEIRSYITASSDQTPLAHRLPWPPTAQTQVSKQYVEIPIQRKRSGDYLQIHHAKIFPRIMKKWVDSHSTQPTQPSPRFKLLTGGVKGTSSAQKQDDFITRHSGGGIKDKKWYRERTYFVTIDWPALSYCIFNKINVIFISSYHKTYMSFTFPQNMNT
jgi:hypothetical protein